MDYCNYLGRLRARPLSSFLAFIAPPQIRHRTYSLAFVLTLEFLVQFYSQSHVLIRWSISLIHFHNEWLSRYFSRDSYGRRALSTWLTHRLWLCAIVVFSFKRWDGMHPCTMYGTYSFSWFKWCWSGSIAMDRATWLFRIQMPSHLTLNVCFCGWYYNCCVSSNITIGDSDNSPLRCCSSEFDENLPTFCEKVFNVSLNSTFYIIDDNQDGFDTSKTVVVVLFFSCISILGCVCAIGYVVFECISLLTHITRKRITKHTVLWAEFQEQNALLGLSTERRSELLALLVSCSLINFQIFAEWMCLMFVNFNLKFFLPSLQSFTCENFPSSKPKTFRFLT